jgi:hypothetical protein
MNKYMRNLGLGIGLASSLYTGCIGLVATKTKCVNIDKTIEYKTKTGEVDAHAGPFSMRVRPINFHLGPFKIYGTAYIPQKVKFGLKTPIKADTSGDALVSWDELKKYTIDELAGKEHPGRAHASQPAAMNISGTSGAEQRYSPQTAQASQNPQNQNAASSQKTIEDIVQHQPVPQNGVDVDEYFDRMISTQFADTSVLGLVKKMTPLQKFEMSRRLQTDARVRNSMYASVSRMNPQQKAQIMVALIDVSKDGIQVVKNLSDKDLLDGAYKLNPNLRYEIESMTPQQKAEVIKNGRDGAEKQMKENIKEMELLLSKLNSQMNKNK